MATATRTADWLKGNGGTEFLQFAVGRITRQRFPLGGYLYTVTVIEVPERTIYTGNDESHARLAIRQAGEAKTCTNFQSDGRGCCRHCGHFHGPAGEA